MKTHRLVNVVPFDESTRYKRVTYEEVKKACGKSSCSTCGGTRLAHGPYWQLVEWDGQQKRTKYIGKELPEEAQEALRARRFLTDPEFRRLVHSTDQLQEELKCRRKEISHLTHKVAQLEADLADAHTRRLRTAASLPERASKIYHKLVAKYHPDRSPATAEFMRDINELWQTVK